MNGECLLDTNIVIALFAGENAITAKLANITVFIPNIVIGELYYGAYNSGHRGPNIARIDEFAAKNLILTCDTITAKYYGEIKNQLRQLGRPIPENDVWIAVLAIQHNLTLVSRDNHFSTIAALDVVKW